MANESTPETNAFLSDVADKLESAASHLETSVGETTAAVSDWSNKYMNANFASKMAYTACYTLAYGVCFPIFVACHYVPKNNRLVEGLVDGGVDANHSVDQMLEKAKARRQDRKQASQESREFSDVVEDGVGALEPA